MLTDAIFPDTVHPLPASAEGSAFATAVYLWLWQRLKGLEQQCALVPAAHKTAGHIVDSDMQTVAVITSYKRMVYVPEATTLNKGLPVRFCLLVDGTPAAAVALHCLQRQ